jgi:hypothetical protein
VIDRKIGKIKVRRGTDSQRVTNIFEEGEVIYSVDKKRIFVGDDTTLGGVPVSNRNYIVDSLGFPPIPPDDVLEGDIIFDKSSSATYITRWTGTEYELLLIGDGNCCIQLQNQIDDLYSKLKSLTGCLTPNPPPPPPPSKLNWVVQPSNNFVVLGDTVTFTASAVGDGNISYVWKRADALTIDTPNIYKDSITITDVSIPDIATYYCVASNAVDSITSINVALAVESNSILAEDGTYILSELEEFIDWEADFASPPVITKQPQTISAIVGSAVTFSIEATGTAPLTYQWKVNGFDIFGETNSTYNITNATIDKIGITCTVSNPAGPAGSNSVNLIVGTPPVITKQPITQSINKGSKVSMNIVVTGSSPFVFQWKKDGTIISGATSDTYTINTAELTDAGSYTCIVSNSFDSVTSNNAVLTVNNIFDAGDLIISADTNNFVLKDALITKGWNGVLPVKVNVIVNSGVTIGSNSSTLPSFKVDSFLTGSVINLTNNGTIVGRGGNGGDRVYGGNGENGLNGGDAINILYLINISNNGIIGGGGGGGGGAAGNRGTLVKTGSDGTIGGVGGDGGVTPSEASGGGFFEEIGGTGGNIGQNGNKGADKASWVGGNGGSAGYYIDGISFVTWSKQGDVRGRVK